MKINGRINCLNSKTKLMICFVLDGKELSLPKVVEEIEKLFKIKTHRETIYRSLESLRKSDIVKKEYFPEEKVIKYSLKIKRIEIDFIKKELQFKN